MLNETAIGITNPLFFIGVVENNVDPRLEGRVQVRAFGIHGTKNEIPTEDLPWATLILGTYDTNHVVPPINSWVFGFFVDGRDSQQPMLLGVIPTFYSKILDPNETQWGNYPPRDADLLCTGSRPKDIGQPIQSRLARGEYIEETYHFELDSTRVKDIPIANDERKWDEPPSAYKAQYPFNRVIETPGGHSIELDDTPGAERISIWHKSGSYIQIDTRGTRTDKVVSDSYEVKENNSHVYIGGSSFITIDGDMKLLIKGNKIEEIYGDYEQIIHGNHIIGGAGQLNFNGSDEIQIRAAKITLESNVESFSVLSAKEIKMTSKESIHIKSEKSIHIFSKESIHALSDEKILLSSKNDTSILSSEKIYLTSTGNSYFKTSGSLFSEAVGDMNYKSGGELRMTSSGILSINGPVVAIDDVIELSSGLSNSADSSEEGETGEPAESAVPVDLSEPPQKSISFTSDTQGNERIFRSSITTSGFSSTDDGDVVTNNRENIDSSVTIGKMKELLDLIGRAEGAGYNTVYGGSRVVPSKPITSMTIEEVLMWQDENVSKGSVSSAAGRYQFLRSTLRDMISKGFVEKAQIFSPEVQDRLAIVLLQRRGLSSYLSRIISENQFADSIAKEWASFPITTGPNAGKSYYHGDRANNKAAISVQEVLDVLKRLLLNHEKDNHNVV